MGGDNKNHFLLSDNTKQTIGRGWQVLFLVVFLNTAMEKTNIFNEKWQIAEEETQKGTIKKWKQGFLEIKYLKLSIFDTNGSPKNPLLQNICIYEKGRKIWESRFCIFF